MSNPVYERRDYNRLTVVPDLNLCSGGLFGSSLRILTEYAGYDLEFIRFFLNLSPEEFISYVQDIKPIPCDLLIDWLKLIRAKLSFFVTLN